MTKTTAYDFDLRYSLRRRFVDEFLWERAATWRAGERVLDLGGARLLKRGRFNIHRYPVKVIYANLTVTRRPDVCADAAYLPFSSHAFDVVVCSEVLEHVPDPRPVLGEIRRVLVPGGQVLITCPFLFRIHGDPDDYGRYTNSYWEREMRDAGFGGIVVKPQGGFHAVIVDFFRQYAVAMKGSGLLARVLGLSLPLLERWALRKQSIGIDGDNVFLGSFTSGWQVSASRPEEPCPGIMKETRT